MTDKLTTLQQKINIKFNNTNLLKQALTHRSYLNETKRDINSYERLEFLGDAVLELIVSEYLYRNYPDLPEGNLTNLRSAMVKTKTLAKISEKLDLGNCLYLSKGEEKGGGRSNNSLLADVFEAVLGAIYLDQGIKKARKFVYTFLIPLLPEIIKTKSYIDYKSNLQTIIQAKSRITPTYEVERETGPDHNKTFYVLCKENSKILGRGKGKSKQAAEQDAARDALEKLES